MAKVKKPGEDNRLRQQGEQDERNLQKEISPLDGKVTKQYYGMKVGTILNAAARLGKDLEYLSSLVEQPDPEFLIKNAVVYAEAVTAISHQIDFIAEDISQNDLSEDGIYVKLTTQEVTMLNTFNTNTEEALARLEEICGISLQNN